MTQLIQPTNNNSHPEDQTELEAVRRTIRIMKLLGEPLSMPLDDNENLLDDSNTDNNNGNCWIYIWYCIKKWFS